MRRISLWALSTVSTLVLLFSYHTSTSSSAAGTVALGAAVPGGASSGSSGGSGSSSSGGGSSSGTGSSSSGAGSSSSASGTYTGAAIQTRFGPVQVQIVVENGKITQAGVTQVPWSSGRDQEINSYAVPILNSEAVDAQTSGIDMVSGATFTSQGYVQSLQSAIDQANL